MSITTDKERIIVLELKITTLMENLLKHVEQEEEHQKKMQNCLQSIKESVNELTLDINKYKGFLGGITLILTSIGTVLFFFKGWLAHKLGIPL